MIFEWFWCEEKKIKKSRLSERNGQAA